MIDKFLASVSLLIALLLTACAHSHRTTAIALSSADPAEVKLAEAASSVSHSLQDLSAIEQAANPQAVLNQPLDPNSYGMGNLASIDWSGPLEPIVARIAKATDYKLRIIGKEPSLPLMVQVAAQNTPLGDILQNVGYQAKKRAKIIVFPSKKIIQLIYTEAGN